MLAILSFLIVYFVQQFYKVNAGSGNKYDFNGISTQVELFYA